MFRNNALVTINVNDVLCENARNSFISAAQRWKIDYIEVINNIAGENVCPHFNKFYFPSRFSSYDRLIYIDSDCLIHAKAPYPLDFFDNPEKFYAVKDLNDKRILPGTKEYDLVYNDVQLKWCKYVEHIFKHDSEEIKKSDWHPDVPPFNVKEISTENIVSNFFNSGFFICSPYYHKDLFERFLSFIPHEPNDIDAKKDRVEQAMLNYMVQLYSEYELIDDTWNYLSPELNQKMHKYIYHFTGFNSWELKEAIKFFDWQ